MGGDIQIKFIILSLIFFVNQIFGMHKHDKKVSFASKVTIYKIPENEALANRKSAFQYVKTGSITKLKMLLKEDPSIIKSLLGKQKCTLLMYAVWRCPTPYFSAITSFLIAAGINISAVDEEGNTILHYAVKYLPLSHIKELMCHLSYANQHLTLLYLKNKKLQAPIDLANKIHRYEVASYLIEFTLSASESVSSESTSSESTSGDDFDTVEQMLNNCKIK
jgi:hypothetical protein